MKGSGLGPGGSGRRRLSPILRIVTETKTTRTTTISNIMGSIDRSNISSLAIVGRWFRDTPLGRRINRYSQSDRWAPCRSSRTFVGGRVHSNTSEWREPQLNGSIIGLGRDIRKSTPFCDSCTSILSGSKFIISQAPIFDNHKRTCVGAFSLSHLEMTSLVEL